jgi:hypothetical protein
VHGCDHALFAHCYYTRRTRVGNLMGDARDSVWPKRAARLRSSRGGSRGPRTRFVNPRVLSSRVHGKDERKETIRLQKHKGIVQLELTWLIRWRGNTD